MVWIFVGSGVAGAPGFSGSFPSVSAKGWSHTTILSQSSGDMPEPRGLTQSYCERPEPRGILVTKNHEHHRNSGTLPGPRGFSVSVPLPYVLGCPLGRAPKPSAGTLSKRSELIGCTFFTRGALVSINPHFVLVQSHKLIFRDAES